jgi:hypothetical protein
MKNIPVVSAFCITLLSGPAVFAQLGTQDLRTAAKMVEKKFFMRLDAPCIYGAKTPAGLWFDPLLEVSPTGHRLLPIPQLSKKQYIYWGSGPNDPVGYGTVRAIGDTVFVWLEGRKPAANEFVIAFTNIRNLDDFKAAFERAFSPVPLEEAHPEWPSEVRNAVRARNIIEGMTKEQAFCVVGVPESIESTLENGISVEIWHPRQENGTRQPYHNMKPNRTGYPAALKFADNKLIAIEKSGGKVP